MARTAPPPFFDLSSSSCDHLHSSRTWLPLICQVPPIKAIYVIVHYTPLVHVQYILWQRHSSKTTCRALSNHNCRGPLASNTAMLGKLHVIIPTKPAFIHRMPCKSSLVHLAYLLFICCRIWSFLTMIFSTLFFEGDVVLLFPLVYKHIPFLMKHASYLNSSIICQRMEWCVWFLHRLRLPFVAQRVKPCQQRLANFTLPWKQGENLLVKALTREPNTRFALILTQARWGEPLRTKVPYILYLNSCLEKIVHVDYDN